jgi:predicted AAA+ superfamily ATPase
MPKYHFPYKTTNGETALNGLEKLHARLRALAIFHDLLSDGVVARLSSLLSCADQPPSEQAQRYAAFVSALYKEGADLTRCLLDRVLLSDNPYIQGRARKEPVPAVMEEALKSELLFLQELSALTPQAVKAELAYKGFLPGWETGRADFTAAYADWVNSVSVHGIGMYAKHTMFAFKDGAVAPVLSPDPVRLTDLKGYAREREAVLRNTLALIDGKPAANALLYGDAGTGKSSTVKAIVNELAGRGLRLVEIGRDALSGIPALIDTLAGNPLKFILFIDDLSFRSDSDDFGALKAVLEGSASARPNNLAVYATSNRRHIVRESFSDRAGDDVHRGETVQELASLSERFGLSVNFYTPDRQQYLDIVRALAEQYGVRMDGETLEREAERWALRRGGRSPRIARQFVEQEKARGRQVTP